MSVPTIKVTGTYKTEAGDPESGTVTFMLNVELRDGVGDLVVGRRKLTSTLDAQGRITDTDGTTVGITLYCTSGGDIQPTSGVVYEVQENIDGHNRRRFVALPDTLGSTADMADLIPVTGNPNLVWTVPDLTAEQARDLVGTTLQAGSGISVTVDDPGDTVTVAADGTIARLASPAFTGNPTAPTPSAGDNDTSVATTAFVTGALATQHTADLGTYDALGAAAAAQTAAIAAAATDATTKVGTETTRAQAAEALLIPLAQKAAANGVASLDSGGKVPIAQLPSSIMEYQGTWNASTNTPTLADGSGSPGDVYRVSVAGTRNLGSGSITFDVGDYAVLNASLVWEKSDTTDAVASVDGLTGAVSLATRYAGIAKVPLSIVSLKSISYTASAGQMVPVDSSAGGVVITLPASPSTGDVVGIKKMSTDSLAITISPNVDGSVMTISTPYRAVLLEWTGSAWISVGSTAHREAHQAGGSDDLTSYFASLPADTDLAVRYVAASGSDSNPGSSWKKAYATIAAAVADLVANHSSLGLVIVGVGTFDLTTTLYVPQGVEIVGSGHPSPSQGTTIQWSGPNDGSFAIVTAASTSGTDYTRGQLRNFRLLPNPTGNSGGAYTNANGLFWRNAQNGSVLTDLTIKDFPGDGLKADVANGVTPTVAYPGFVSLLRVWCSGNNVNFRFGGGFTSVKLDMCAGDFSANTTDICIIEPKSTGDRSKDANYTFDGFKTEANGAADQDLRYFTISADVNVKFDGCSGRKTTPGTKPWINYSVTPGSANNVSGTIPVTIIDCTIQNIAIAVQGPDGVSWLQPSAATGGEVFQIAEWNGQRRSRIGAPAPEMHGLFAWSGDPIVANATTIPVGVCRAVKMRAPFHRVLSSVQIPILTGATCTNAWVGIVDSTGALVGLSADQATPFATSGVKSVAITVQSGKSLAVRENDDFYVVVLIGGGTSPSFAQPAGAGNSIATNMGLTAAAGLRSWSSGSSLTAIPTSFTLSSTTAVGGLVLCGVI